MRAEGGGAAGSQPMSIAVHRSPNKLWRSNFIFSLCAWVNSLALENSLYLRVCAGVRNTQVEVPIKGAQV